MEHTHNNPIVHAFVALLSSSSSPHSQQQQQQQQQQQSPANDRQRLIFGSIQQETTPLVSMKRRNIQYQTVHYYCNTFSYIIIIIITKLYSIYTVTCGGI